MAMVNIDDYPQLATLCWNRKTRTAEESEALRLYEAGWRFIDRDSLTVPEADLISRLADTYGNGVLNV